MNYYRRVRMKVDEAAPIEMYGFTPCSSDGNPRRTHLTDSSAKAVLLIVGTVSGGVSTVVPRNKGNIASYYEVLRGCVGERFSAVDDADAWQQVKDLWFADL
jgi:hypothetical protein